jgi:hypothetical protein
MRAPEIEFDLVTFTAVADRFWDFVATDGLVFARAEIFVGDDQWGVRLADRRPEIPDAELLRLVARLLVWSVNCPADTVEVVLSRTHDRHVLVKVAGDYV